MFNHVQKLIILFIYLLRDLNSDNSKYFSGFSRSFYQQPEIGKQRRASWHADTGLDSGVQEFFSVRVGALDQALDECRYLLDPEIDGDVKGMWLLTE